MNKKLSKNKKKIQKKEQNDLYIKQIDSWLSKADTSKLIKTIDSLNKELKYKKNNEIDKIEKEIKNKKYQLAEIKKLYDKKENLLKQNQSLNVDKTILEELQKAKSKKINFKDKNLQSLMNMTRFQKLMYSMDELKIGRFYLDIKGISEFTSIDGIKIKVKPNNFYFQATTGRIFQSSYFNIMLPNNQIYVSGVTIGKDNDKQNFGFHYYYFTGNTSTRNTIIGIEHSKNWSKKIKTAFLLTASQSLNTSQKEDIIQFQGIKLNYPSYFPNTLFNVIKQNKSLFYQTGFRLEFSSKLTNIFSKKDLWNIKYERVSPFYQNTALPFILRDYHGFSLENQWNLFKNKWKLSMIYQYKEDNLSHLKPLNTYWNIASIQLNKHAKKINLKSAYQIIYRNSAFISTYQNISQIIHITTPSLWEIKHILNANILLNKNILLNQYYNYQITFSPAKNWNIYALSGINIINNETYFNFNSTGTFMLKKWNLSLSYQIITNKRITHQKTIFSINKVIFKNLSFHLESGYGNVPVYILNNELSTTSYWNGALTIKYNFK